MSKLKHLRYCVYRKSEIQGQNDLLIAAFFFLSDAYELANLYNSVVLQEKYYVAFIDHEN